jgi:carboxylesterase type B
MSTDQQRLWTAAQSVAAAVYRPESGAAVTTDEVRQVLERYFPLSTDDMENKKLKRALRDELDKTLANISGLPQQLQDTVLDGLLTKHEQELAKNGPQTPAPVIRSPSENEKRGLGPQGQRPWR